MLRWYFGLGVAIVSALGCSGGAAGSEGRSRDGVATSGASSGGAENSPEPSGSLGTGARAATDGTGSAPAVPSAAGGGEVGNAGPGGELTSTGTGDSGGGGNTTSGEAGNVGGGAGMTSAGTGNSTAGIQAAGAGVDAEGSHIWFDTSSTLMIVSRNVYYLQDGSTSSSETCERYTREEMTSEQLETLGSIELVELELAEFMDGCAETTLVVIDAAGTYESYLYGDWKCGVSRDGETALAVPRTSGLTGERSEDCVECAVDADCPSGTCMVGYCGGA